MPNANRRRFLKCSAATVGTLAAAPAIATSALSANDRVRVAVVGLGGRGRRAHCPALRELAAENVEIVALSDCERNRLNAAADEQEKFSGKRPRVEVDFRKLLDDGSVDAISIATPDHWHALQAIWCCQAGKDVYCEKPASHNIFEGGQMVKAARKYDRIVQIGTQCRSSPNIREAVAKLREGVIGRVYMARAIAYKYMAGAKNQFGPVPDGLDWDRWQGPAQEKPFNGLIFGRWRFLKDYGSGQVADQGVHEMDIARWGLGIESHPTRIQAMGAVNLFHPTSAFDTPSNLMLGCEYEGRDQLLGFETRDGFTNAEAGMGIDYPFVDHRNVVGVIFFGTEGYMIVPDYSSYYTFLGVKREPGPFKKVDGAPMMNTDHFRNWINAIRSRRREELHAEVAEGHLSTCLPLLANIAFWTKRTLQFDPKTERFIDDEQANRYLKPDYREPYIVPDEV